MRLLSERGEFIQSKGRFTLPKTIAGYITLDETGKILLPFGCMLVAETSVFLYQDHITIKARVD